VFVDLKIVHAGALQGRIKIRKQFFHEDSHGHLHRLTIPIAWRFASPDHSHRLTIRIDGSARVDQDDKNCSSSTNFSSGAAPPDLTLWHN